MSAPGRHRRDRADHHPALIPTLPSTREPRHAAVTGAALARWAWPGETTRTRLQAYRRPPEIGGAS